MGILLFPTMLFEAFVILLFSIDVLAASLHRSSGPVVKDQYIVYVAICVSQKRLIYVRSVLKTGTNTSAEIEHICSSLAVDCDNEISVKYIYSACELADHHSSVPLTQYDDSPEWVQC